MEDTQPNTETLLPNSNPIPSPEPEKQQSPKQEETKKKIEPKHLWTVIGISVGAIVVLIIGAMLFLPQLYIALAQRKAIPSFVTTNTAVHVNREMNSAATEDTEAQTYTETVDLTTETQYSAPSSWAYTTTLTSGDNSINESIEVIVANNSAYQRQAAVSEEWTKYPLQAGDYETTEKAISSSSLFVPQLFDYAGNTRFVWNTEGQPWWALHYRVPIDVNAIEADYDAALADYQAAHPTTSDSASQSTEPFDYWYDPQLYPFSLEDGVAEQEVDLMIDLWVNPFTGQVMHEVWDITKHTADASGTDVTLGITLNRSYDYSTPVSIQEPAVQAPASTDPTTEEPAT